VVVRDLAKVEARVRFSYPAPLFVNVLQGICSLGDFEASRVTSYFHY
jgi:hypothetical protein